MNHLLETVSSRTLQEITATAYLAAERGSQAEFHGWCAGVALGEENRRGALGTREEFPFPDRLPLPALSVDEAREALAFCEAFSKGEQSVPHGGTEETERLRFEVASFYDLCAAELRQVLGEEPSN